MRRNNSDTQRVVMELNVHGKRRRGRSKKRWIDEIENDLRMEDVSEKQIED